MPLGAKVGGWTPVAPEWLRESAPAFGTLSMDIRGYQITEHRRLTNNRGFAASFNFEDAFAGRFIGNDGDVSTFEAGGFVQLQPRVGHEENLVVESPLAISEGPGSIQRDGQRRQEGNLPRRLERTGSS